MAKTDSDKTAGVVLDSETAEAIAAARDVQDKAAASMAAPAPGAPDPWMVWKGRPGESTPPLPGHDLSEAEVLLFVQSMAEASGYEKTGLWELHIPDGKLRKTAPEVQQG